MDTSQQLSELHECDQRTVQLRVAIPAGLHRALRVMAAKAGKTNTAVIVELLKAAEEQGS
ncbi:MAG: hypothetical protein OEZ06_28030 [Myxococcales bacterium]|nr:hypothetical protein [Myxococcales bacterium]